MLTLPTRAERRRSSTAASSSSSSSYPSASTTSVCCVSSPVRLALLLLTLFVQSSASQFTQNQLPTDTFGRWAELFGQTIYAVSAKATALTDLQTDYLLLQPQVKPINGSELLREIKTNMEKMFKRKVEAVRRLVNVAQKSYAEYNTSAPLSTKYPKAKKLKEDNTTEFELVPSEHFYNVPVNLTRSTVHVPTNVYDQSNEILTGVAWSEALDEMFQENYQRDPTLSWQYFGSSSGFFRNYPGIAWPIPKNSVDLYDCRTRGWYIQAATSPKDMVILLDSSGSMKGLRMEIAKATVAKIVETLSDDDFFNVIKFSEEPEYVDPCFNGTLVQANNKTKERIKKALEIGIATKNIARFEKALTTAFDLLISMNTTERGAQCNKAIMIITDGAPDTYEELFTKYNRPNIDVRVFTYLIGREVGDPRQVMWMACSNKGYYSHISTLADVHEHVQEYIHVCSRPMVISQANQTEFWTNVYLDTSHTSEGTHFTTSVAQPVYDTRNGTRKFGILLGVMGTDVPINEIIKLVPCHKLGVNGYAFAITNNGYVLFHPDLRSMSSASQDIENFNSIDLSEVELLHSPEDKTLDESFSNRNLLLRKRMVDRENSELVMTVKIHYDGMKRVTVRKNHYFFAPIKDTPFSLGIALPDGYGMNSVDGKRRFDSSVDLSALRYGDLQIAPWTYCQSKFNLSSVEALVKSLEMGRVNMSFYEQNCDDDLVTSLLFDAEATRGVVANWLKENSDAIKESSDGMKDIGDGALNHNAPRDNDIEMVFVGTKSGLTRYYSMSDNLSDPDFIEKNKLTIKAPYYTRAAEAGDGVFTFSMPFTGKRSNANRSAITNSTMITASTPIVISIDGRDSVAAVVGLRMRYSKFYQLFMDSTKFCAYNGNEGCNLTCESADEIACYLLDEHGYVILSSDFETDPGRFFGEIEGALMKKLIIEDSSEPGFSQEGVFSRIPIYDYQATCDVWRRESAGAQSNIINPFRQVVSSLFWVLRKLYIFLIEINLFSWWSEEWPVVHGFTESPPFDADPEGLDDDEYDQSAGGQFYSASGDQSDDERMFDEMAEFATKEQVEKWINDWRQMVLQSKSKAEILQWRDRIFDMHGPKIVDRRSCTKQRDIYRVDWDVAGSQLPFVGEISQCDPMSDCTSSKSFSIHRVPRTNLMLVVIDARCKCGRSEQLQLQPVEIKHNDTAVCERLQTEIYRRRPPHCYSYHPDEDSSRCGGAVDLRHSCFGVLTLLALNLLL